MIYLCRCGSACSHIAAVLFKVDAAVRLGLTERAVTSVACMWNKCYKEKVSYTKYYMNISIYQ